MDISKIQTFLRKKNKFAPKKDTNEIFFELLEETKKLEQFIKRTSKSDIDLDVAIANYFLKLLQTCNLLKIDLEKTLTEKLSYEI
ncbi:MAG: hypothetical protein ACTSWY_11280 [Promethearchaeota archaeon]